MLLLWVLFFFLAHASEGHAICGWGGAPTDSLCHSASPSATGQAPGRTSILFFAGSLTVWDSVLSYPYGVFPAPGVVVCLNRLLPLHHGVSLIPFVWLCRI
mmetsp:Transcript_100961/g.170710  ORF Transcript_100961/g.170710 Transcript_100961/m.170710 type:complete len:101 (-) Transcript_100961:41-343(-)